MRGILSDDNPRGVLGKDDGAHLLEWYALGLWQDEVEEYGVGEIADGKQDEIAPPDGLYGDAGYLPDERVEGV